MPPLPPSLPTRTDGAALRAQATPWRTPTSSGSSTAAFGSWSTRWLPHMLERWSAQPPPPTHRACHHRLTPPQLAADILVPVALQEAAGPCKGGVMTGGSVAPCTRAGAPFGGRGLSHTVGRERCSRWRRLACGWACAVCHLSCLRVYGVISVRPLGTSESSLSLQHARVVWIPTHLADETDRCLTSAEFLC